jgi:parallel beta-helix repeat protein
LDLNGHTLSGEGPFYGFGVFIYGASNVTVKNGTITNFAQGVLFLSRTDGSGDHSPAHVFISNNKILNNLRGLFGNRTGSLEDLTVEDNQISGNSAGAIVLFNAVAGTIQRNILCDNGKYGVSLSNSESMVIHDNTMTNNSNGVVFYAYSNDNAVYRNAFCGNYNGILIYSGQNNRIASNNFIESKHSQAYDADRNSWESNFWSDQRDCPNPYIINSTTGAKDSNPRCSAWPDLPSCVCAAENGSICGSKFNDLNNDGHWEDNEPGLEGWTINLEGPVNMSTITEPDGSFCFVDLPSGTYTVGETLVPGWIQTFPPDGKYVIDLTMGESEGDIDFGNFKIPR